MRVVLDTNILVSSLLSPGGEADRIYQAWRSGRFILVSSEEQLDEFRRVTRYPRLRLYIHTASAGTMVNEVRLLARIVSDLPRVDVSPDPGDNFVLAMAEKGEADYLVSRNRLDLLALVRHKKTAILTPQQFVQKL